MKFSCALPSRVWAECATLAVIFLFAAALHCQQPQGPQQTQGPQQPVPPQPSPQQRAGQPPKEPAPPASATTAAPPSAGSISTQANLVTLYATVRDKKGKIISNLEKDNFTVEEDGHPQSIKYFARDTDIPLILGLLVDTSRSQRHVIGAERTASSAFFDHMLRVDKDKAFLIHFDREVELLEDLTNSREKLRTALQDLRVSDSDEDSGGSGGRGGGGGGGGRGSGGYHRAGTLLCDSIYLAANEIMKKQQGRKAVVVLTDGEDRGSKVTLSAAIEAAQRADMLVYSVLFIDPDAPRYYSSSNQGPYGGGRRGGQGRYPQQEQRPDGKKTLERIARETGGRFFQVNKKESVEQIYAELEDELRKQYTLAYTPASISSGTGKAYHMLKVTTNQKDLIVQSRDGYYSEE